MLYFYRLSDAIDCISTPADAIDIPFMFPRMSNITLFLPEAHSIHTTSTFNINELDALRPDFSDFIYDICLQNWWNFWCLKFISRCKINLTLFLDCHWLIKKFNLRKNCELNEIWLRNWENIKIKVMLSPLCLIKWKRWHTIVMESVEYVEL